MPIQPIGNKSLTHAIMFAFLYLIISGCHDKTSTAPSIYSYIQPQYDLVDLHLTGDTLIFQLSENTYNDLKSFNLFTQDGVEYFSFFDERSASVNIYNFNSQKRVKKIKMKKILPKKELYKTSVFCKNFDSIFITNMKTLYLADSTGSIQESIDFLEKRRPIYAVFDNTTPPFFKNNILNMGVRPYVDSKSAKALKDWKVIYNFTIKMDKATLHYPLPELYRNNLYGYHFLDYSYCINNRGNFVFSFPADTSIYETNLSEYHNAYFAKSSFQTSDIQPLTKQELENSDESFKKYATQDSYGPIYFDSHNKRYLRVVKLKMSEQDFKQKKQQRNYYFIIFNEQFQIVGESPIDPNLSYGTVMQTQSGKVYVRTKASDENAIYLVQLEYTENFSKQLPLSKK